MASSKGSSNVPAPAYEEEGDIPGLQGPYRLIDSEELSSGTAAYEAGASSADTQGSGKGLKNKCLPSLYSTSKSAGSADSKLAAVPLFQAKPKGPSPQSPGAPVEKTDARAGLGPPGLPTKAAMTADSENTNLPPEAIFQAAPRFHKPENAPFLPEHAREAEKEAEPMDFRPPEAKKAGPLGSLLRTITPQQTAKAESMPFTEKATFRIRMDLIKQTLVGIGYSNAFYQSWWHYHPNQDQIYDALLKELQPSILRLRNTAFLTNDYEREMQVDKEFVQIAREKLDDEPQILLSLWTPPAWMKLSRTLNGARDSQGRPTSILDKDNNGYHRYYDFSMHWVNSLKRYHDFNVYPRWISPINEPDFFTEFHQTCFFTVQPSADGRVAGYYRAASEIHERLMQNFSNPPGMIGPECFGMDRYIDNHPYGGGGQFEAIANHLYASTSNHRDPYSFDNAMGNAARIASEKAVSNLWMSEYTRLGKHERQDAIRLAIVMHRFFTIAQGTAYLVWDGAWGNNTHNDEGTMLLVDNPNGQWSNSNGYNILRTFYWFKHFCRFLRPGYRRAQVDYVSGSQSVLVSSWTGPNGKNVVILVNTNNNPTNVTLLDMPEWVGSNNTNYYFSTLEDNDPGFTHGGHYCGNTIMLPKTSITSIVTL